MDVVCAIIQDSDGRVLAAQRPLGKALAGHWEFPGGKIEPGESAPAALVREIQEELGCRLVVGAALTPVLHPYPGGAIRLLPFFASIEEGEPEAREHAALRWVDRNQASALTWAPADVPILAELWSAIIAPDSPPA